MLVKGATAHSDQNEWWSQLWVGELRIERCRIRIICSDVSNLATTCNCAYVFVTLVQTHNPDSKVPGANMGPIWGRRGPGGPHVGPRNLAIWDCLGYVEMSFATNVLSAWHYQGIFLYFLKYIHECTPMSFSLNFAIKLNTSPFHLQKAQPQLTRWG